MIPLPPELTDHIIDYLHLDVHALRACALTCRAWLPGARYHRFRTLNVANDTALTAFEVLVASSPAIGPIVEDLRIYYCTFEQLRSALPLLPTVRRLELHHGMFRDFSLGDPAAIGVKLPALRELTMGYCVLPLAALSQLLCSFTGLESVSLSQIYGFESVNTSVVGRVDALHTLRLRYTYSDLSTDEEHLVGWLIGTLQPNQLKALHISRVRDPGLIQPLLDAFGPRGLKRLRVDLYNVRKTARDTAFTLEPCTNLRLVSIELGIHWRMSEPSTYLLWFSVLISQLNSPFLETITLTVIATSLVGPVLWRFDDLQALDWRSINRTLGRAVSKDLRVFNIRGRGPRESLEACLEEQCRTAYTRGLFQFIEQ